MADVEGKITPLPIQSDRVSASFGGYQITGDKAGGKPIRGAGPQAWFGPLEPLPPMAPPGTGGRQFDYPFGANLNYIPRSSEPVTFDMLRSLADSLPMLRIVIEKRKNQMLASEWSVQRRLDPKDRRPRPGSQADPRVQEVTKLFRRPDKRNVFRTWFRSGIEDMLVIDAATIYPVMTRGGDLYALDFIDGATIKPLIGADGRAPMPPEPAYQQILKGIPAAEFTSDELIYLPRNVRTNRFYGYGPVEQVVLTVNIALQREIFNLNYYKEGSIPDSFVTVPEEWTTEEIKQFQEYFDTLLSGNLALRRKLRFLPGGAKVEPVKQPPLKDQYDDWLFRIICQAFSVPASALADTSNRATAETLQLTANDEGLVELKGWAKDAIFDYVIQEIMGYEDLEFVWSGDESLDILQQAQSDDFYVRNGTKSRDEIRTKLGLEPWGIGPTCDHAIFPLEESYAAMRTLVASEGAGGVLPTLGKPDGASNGGGGASSKVPTPAAGAGAASGGVKGAGRKAKAGSASTSRTAKKPGK